MPKGQVFWLVYIVMVLLGCGWYWKDSGSRSFGPYLLIVLILVGLLGWGLFGAVVK